MRKLVWPQGERPGRKAERSPVPKRIKVPVENNDKRNELLKSFISRVEQSAREEKEEALRMMRESEIEDLARVKKESYASALSDALAVLKGMKNRPDNAIMDVARERENKMLNNAIIALSALTGKEK